MHCINVICTAKWNTKWSFCKPCETVWTQNAWTKRFVCVCDCVVSAQIETVNKRLYCLNSSCNVRKWTERMTWKHKESLVHASCYILHTVSTGDIFSFSLFFPFIFRIKKMFTKCCNLIEWHCRKVHVFARLDSKIDQKYHGWHFMCEAK